MLLTGHGPAHRGGQGRPVPAPQIPGWTYAIKSISTLISREW